MAWQNDLCLLELSPLPPNQAKPYLVNAHGLRHIIEAASTYNLRQACQTPSLLMAVFVVIFIVVDVQSPGVGDYF
ncbi:hypothetical protein K449DRAFT_432015 [Hypoxylon sp. EC38]|nr:hypothetical protein K449DRAFT_432015 [Hypoxylon sp. EC38]